VQKDGDNFSMHLKNAYESKYHIIGATGALVATTILISLEGI
jgi:hypothetical protein